MIWTIYVQNLDTDEIDQKTYFTNSDAYWDFLDMCKKLKVHWENKLIRHDGYLQIAIAENSHWFLRLSQTKLINV